MEHNKTIIFNVRKDLLYKNLSCEIKDEISKLTLKNLEIILYTLTCTSKSKLIIRDVDMFKMRYGVGYDRVYLLREISEKYSRAIQNVVYNINKIKDMLVRYIKNKNLYNNTERSCEDNSIVIHENINRITQSNHYIKYLADLSKEKILTKDIIAIRLASRDIIIEDLYIMLLSTLTSLETTGNTSCSITKSRLESMNLHEYLKNTVS